jgi:hypothetical protein
MLSAATSGDVNRIVVYNLDRLYRRPRELEPIIDLADRGLIVADVDKGDLDLSTGDGRYNVRIVVAGAAKMSDDTSRRVRRAKQQNRERGLPHGGRTSFGWTDLMTPLPEEVEILRHAMQRVVQGASMNDLAVDWTRRAVRGRRWNGSDVRRVLILPRHVALVPVNGDEWMRDATGAEVVATWPAIVERQLWEDCRAVLAARATGVGVPRRRSWLTGRLFCGACGTGMTSSSSGKRHIWRCWGGTIREGCGKVSIGTTPLEAGILDELFRYVDDAKLRAALSTRDDRGIAKLRREFAALQVRSNELVDAFADRGLTASAYRMAADRLDAQRKELNVKLGRLTEQSPLDRFAKRHALRDAWPDLSVDERRSIVAAVYPRIVVLPAAKRGCRFYAARIQFG